MKKFLVIFFLIILLLCSCDKKEYHLIELSAEEFLNHFSNDDCDMVVAFYNDTLENSETFLNDLNEVAKKAKINVYYIDVNHINMMSLFILDSAIELPYDSLKYIVYQDGVKIVDEEYTTMDKMYSDLNGKKYEEVELMSDEEKESVLEEAKKLYDEGYISQAYDSCLAVWNYDKAKEFVHDNNLFKIINYWEYQEVDSSKKMNYLGMVFLSFDGALFMIDETVDKEDFEKPNIGEFDDYYYRINNNNNNNLCISDEMDSECVYEYEILSVSDNLLRMKKDEKEYKFTILKEVD